MGFAQCADRGQQRFTAGLFDHDGVCQMARRETDRTRVMRDADHRHAGASELSNQVQADLGFKTQHDAGGQMVAVVRHAGV